MSKIALEIRKNNRERCWDMFLDPFFSFPWTEPAIFFDSRWERLVKFCERRCYHDNALLFYSYDEIEGELP